MHLFICGAAAASLDKSAKLAHRQLVTSSVWEFQVGYVGWFPDGRDRLMKVFTEAESVCISYWHGEIFQCTCQIFHLWQQRE